MSEVSIRSGPRPPPRLSIVIDNYRYEQFVARTIESALEQTVAERVEVIVIDDGSPDNSMEVINRYADRVQVIAKPNGGQASAYNLGFQVARGELILFLDADDWLYPDAAAEILAAWVPGVSKLQFPLDLVDVAGDPLYRQVPRTLQDSEEAEQLMRDWGAYGSPPGSGNVYHRDYLRQVLPLDEATWTTAADSVPVLLAPAYGRVVSLRRALGVYRVHRSSTITPAACGPSSCASWRASRRWCGRWTSSACRTPSRSGWRRGRRARWCCAPALAARRLARRCSLRQRRWSGGRCSPSCAGRT
jgi:hypothetical protein